MFCFELIAPFHYPRWLFAGVHLIMKPLLLQVHHKSLSLGEVLDGDRMAESLYVIPFQENVDKKTLCKLTLSEKQVIFEMTHFK